MNKLTSTKVHDFFVSGIVKNLDPDYIYTKGDNCRVVKRKWKGKMKVVFFTDWKKV